MKKFLYWLNYFDAPLVKEKGDNHLILESIRNKVWNPVFTIGAVTFFLSMTLRGFFNQAFAVIPLGLSTFILFSGIWILSATAQVIFDKNESKVYFVYKHLGYLQKVYLHALTSFDEIQMIDSGNGKFRIQLLKDDGTTVVVARKKDPPLLQATATEVSEFLNIPLRKT